MSAIPSVRVRTSGWQADVSETFLTHCEAQALANTDTKFMVTVLEVLAVGGSGDDATTDLVARYTLAKN